MANVGTLSIKFTGDAKQLENTFTRVGVKANLFASGITGVLKTAAGAAAGFVKSAISIASENENTLTSFQNLTGSIGAAKKLYADLLEFSSKTPFSSKEIQSGATTLLGFGLSAADATKAIKELGAAAAANADTDLKRLVVSFGQIQGAGVAMTKDLREFVNNGIPIYQILSETLDVSVDKINDLASSGKITADVITRAFQESASAGGRFADTLDLQSKTLAGLTSTLKDNFAIVLGKIGDTLLPVLKDAVEKANAALVEFREAVDAGALNPFIAGIGAIVSNVGLLAEAARDGIGPLVGIYDALKAVKQASEGNFAEAWNSAKSAAEEYLRPLKNLANLSERVNQVTGSYNETLRKLNLETASAGDFFNDYANGFDEVITKTKTLGDETEDTTKKVKELSLTYAELQASIASFNPDLKVVGGALDRLSQPPSPDQLPSANLFIARPISSGLAKSPEQEAQERQDAIDAEKKRVDDLRTSLELLADASSTFGNVFVTSMAEGAKASKALAIAVLSTARDVVGALIREGVAAAISNALKGPAGKVPILGIALAGLAGGLAQALFNSVLSKIKIPAFGDGGVVYGPTLALIGEKGPEAVVPLGRSANTGGMRVEIAGVQRGVDTYWQNANVGMVGRLIYGR